MQLNAWRLAWQISKLGRDPTYVKNLGTFVIGAGRGTTGTHFVYWAMCEMGLASVHWDLNCNIVSPSEKAGLAAHEQLRGMYVQTSECLKTASANCGSVVDWAGKGKWLVDQVVNSGLQAIHDAPYPFFMPYLLYSVSQLRHDQPFLVLTNRDPSSWTQHRLTEHGEDLICKQRSLDHDSFDLFRCARVAIEKAAQEKASETPRVNDVFERQDIFVHQEDGRQVLEAELVRYQGAYAKMSNLTINLWTMLPPSKTKRWSSTDLKVALRRVGFPKTTATPPNHN